MEPLKKPITNNKKMKPAIKMAVNRDGGIYYGPFKLTQAAATGSAVCACINDSGRQIPITFN